MVASTPGPLFMSRPAAASSRPARADALLDAGLVGEVGGEAHSSMAASIQRRHDAAALPRTRMRAGGERSRR